MVWCRRVTSNYLSQCQLGLSSIPLYGVTRTHFVAQWRHITTLIWFKIGSGNEWLVAWRRQACSALNHYLNKLKGRWFVTSWWPCWVTVITKLQNAISVLQIIKLPVRECGGLLYYQSGHAVERTVERLVIGNIMTLMWRHCNNNLVSILQMITSPVRECGCIIGSDDGLLPVWR